MERLFQVVFLKKEFDRSLTCVCFCMKISGKGAYSHFVCTRVMRLALSTTVKEDRKFVEPGLNTSLNEMVSKCIGSENGIVLQFQSEALRL